MLNELSKELKMKQKNKRLVLWAFLIYAGANLLAYLISHFAPYIKNDILGGTAEYFVLYSITALDFLATTIIATLLFVIYTYKGIAKTVSAALIMSSARVFYVLPYLYMQLFYSYGTFDALMLSLFGALRTVLLTAIGAFISLCIGLFVLRIVLKKKHTELVPMLPDLVKKKSGTDFLQPENLPILVFALLRFAFEIVMEIIYTVSFFITYGSDYSAVEIVTMLVNYVLLFALLIASYLLSCRIKNELRDYGEDNECAVRECEESTES